MSCGGIGPSRPALLSVLALAQCGRAGAASTSERLKVHATSSSPLCLTIFKSHMPPHGANADMQKLWRTRIMPNGATFQHQSSHVTSRGQCSNRSCIWPYDLAAHEPVLTGAPQWHDLLDIIDLLDQTISRSHKESF